MIKNVLRLLSGNALGQVIQMGSLFFLAALYTSSDFGHFGNIQAMTTIAVVIFTLQLQHTIPISEKNEEAFLKARMVIQIVFGAFLMFFFVGLFTSSQIIYISIYALILALPTVFNNLLISLSKFAILSHTYIVRAVLIVLCQFTFYYFNIYNGLLFATIFGEMLTLVYILSLNRFWSLLVIKISFEDIKAMILEWKSFAFYGTIQECLSVMVYSLPVILYVNKFGESIGGQFSMAYKVTFAPIILVSSSLAQVLTNKFGRENDYSIIKNVIWFDKRILLAVVTVLVVVFTISKSEIIFMGGKWDITIQLIPYLLLNGFFFLLAMPFRLALRVLKRNVDILKIEIATVATLGLMFYFLRLDVISFTIIMCVIALLQNMGLVYSFFMYNKIKNTI